MSRKNDSNTAHVRFERHRCICRKATCNVLGRVGIAPRESTWFGRVIVIAAAILLATPLYEASAQEYVFTTFAGPEGISGFDGTGSAARFIKPRGVAVDSDGNVYVSDSRNHTIRRVTPAGVVTTLAGLAGSFGAADGTGSGARFNEPGELAVDADGNVYVADTYNHTIRKITPQGQVSTLAGAPGTSGAANGVGSAARFHSPYGIAVDADGNVYVADVNNTIRKLSAVGEVTTFAGLPGPCGFADGPGTDARFCDPASLALDGVGNVYVADYGNNTIRRITAAGVVSTLAGFAGWSGSEDGTGSAARFYGPNGVAVDADGNVFVSDSSNHTVRKVTPAGVVTTVAGSAGAEGGVDAAGSSARFYSPTAVAVDASGNVYVADFYNDSIRKITPTSVVTTLAGLTDRFGSVEATGRAARFDRPGGIAIDPAGNLYVADFLNSSIRKVTAAGVVTTLAGLAGTFGSADGSGSEARFFRPRGIAADASGVVFVADTENHTIRTITPAGEVTTLAGLAGSHGSADGTGSAARFWLPVAIALDGDGNAYVVDMGNHTIRRVSPAGEVTTLAGLAGAKGGTDGTGAAARFYSPEGLAVDEGGIVYVGDSGNHTIRRITPAGEVTTIAGLAGQYGTDDGTGSAARFQGPRGLAVDGNGNVFVADAGNESLIRRISPAGAVTTIAGRIVHSSYFPPVAGGEDGVGSEARFDGPYGVAIDASGNLFVADAGSSNIRRGAVRLPGSMSIDDPAGFVGATHQLTFSGSASGYSWRLTRVPSSSTSTLSSEAAASPTLTPDVQDEYQIQLTVTDGASDYVGRISLSAPRLSGVPLSVAEADAFAYVTIALSEAQTVEVTADWATMDRRAIAGSDYVAASGSLSFAPGELAKTVAIQILDNSLNEFDAAFQINLTNVSVVQNGGSAVVTIVDDDPMPTISMNDVSVTEGDSGTTNATFIVTLSEPSGRVVECGVASVNGTADTFDYSSINEHLRFDAGEVTKSVTLRVYGDAEVEDDETIYVNLSVWESSGATIQKGQGICTIVNDDGFIPGNAPGGLTAQATSPTNVSLSWSAFEDAVGYKVFRSSDGTTFGQIGSTASTSFSDTTASPATSYLYKVRATDGVVDSMDSSADLATTVLFTDPNLVAGVTTAKAAHVTELRTAVNAVRQLAGLAAATFTDSTLMTIRRVHVVELRTALDAARTALGLPAIAHTDPTITAGLTRIKAAHVQELRDGVR